MPTKNITTETTLTVAKHLLNGRDDHFIATTTGLGIAQAQDIKVSRGYPDLDKMEWSRDILEERINESVAATAKPGPTIRAAAAPTSARAAAQAAPRPPDPRPVTSTARE